MGDRSWIQIQSKEFATPLAFYGHWSGENNLKSVLKVLNRTTRIGDPGYLAAQIFAEFAREYDGELGYGIYVADITGEWEDNPTIYVDADDGSYRIEDQDRWITNQELRATYYDTLANVRA